MVVNVLQINNQHHVGGSYELAEQQSPAEVGMRLVNHAKKQNNEQPAVLTTGCVNGNCPGRYVNDEKCQPDIDEACSAVQPINAQPGQQCVSQKKLDSPSNTGGAVDKVLVKNYHQT